MALADEKLVEAVLSDWRTAPAAPGLRATLGFLEKLTLEPQRVTSADVEAVREAGVSDQAIEEAARVCALFNMIDRIADALGFEVPPAPVFGRMAARLIQAGYMAAPGLR